MQASEVAIVELSPHVHKRLQLWAHCCTSTSTSTSNKSRGGGGAGRAGEYTHVCGRQ